MVPLKATTQGYRSSGAQCWIFCRQVGGALTIWHGHVCSGAHQRTSGRGQVPVMPYTYFSLKPLTDLDVYIHMFEFGNHISYNPFQRILNSRNNETNNCWWPIGLPCGRFQRIVTCNYLDGCSLYTCKTHLLGTSLARVPKHPNQELRRWLANTRRMPSNESSLKFFKIHIISCNWRRAKKIDDFHPKNKFCWKVEWYGEVHIEKPAIFDS